METINSYLNRVFSDFRNYVDSGSDLCELNNSHFSAGNLPDYSNLNIQQLYLLRYAYAYAFEYKYMYHNILQYFEKKNEIEVTSIGCGSMIDYWSLTQVVKPETHIRYYGIDIIDWHYKTTKRPNDEIYLHIGDAVDYCNQYQKTSDIYIFPKSISEFSPIQLQNLANGFISQYIMKDTIHILVSLRTDEHNLTDDIFKAEILYKKMLELGFRNIHPNSLQPYVMSKDIVSNTIANVDSTFTHPSEIIDYLKVLNQRCINHNNCPLNNSCYSTLTRFPILKCNYAKWLSMSFERRGT